METEFENTVTCLSGAQIGSNHEKQWRSKILWHTPFNVRKRSFSEKRKLLNIAKNYGPKLEYLVLQRSLLLIARSTVVITCAFLLPESSKDDIFVVKGIVWPAAAVGWSVGHQHDWCGMDSVLHSHTDPATQNIIFCRVHLFTLIPTAVGIYILPTCFARFNSHCLVWQSWLAVALKLCKHALQMPRKLCCVYYDWLWVFRGFMLILFVVTYGPQEAVSIKVQRS